MMRSLLILTISLFLLACDKSGSDAGSQAQYTYGVKSWETLGTQTLVLLDAGNPSHMDQDITFKVEVINTEGKKFSKDTTIHFSNNERAKDFQLLIDTEGEVDKVKVIAAEGSKIVP